MSRFRELVLFSGILLAGIGSHAQTISTFAGNNTSGYSGDGGQATAAQLSAVYDVAVDGSGNVYICDQDNYVVRKVNAAGVISTYAGNEALGSGYSGDGGQATAAQLTDPTGIALDASGNLYIADYNAFVVRMVSTSGIITTVAGNGTYGDNGDGGAATAAAMGNVIAVAVDASGNLYIGDESFYNVRVVNTAGIINLFAGASYGYSGDGGAATAAQLGGADGLAADNSGNVYISDPSFNVIRKVDVSGTIWTYAGNGSSGYSGDGGMATAAALNGPSNLSMDNVGNLYVADVYNQAVRQISGSGIITTYAGNGTSGYSGDGGMATAAHLSYPEGVAAVPNGNKVYIADYNNYVVRLVQTGAAATFEYGAAQYDTICENVAYNIDVNLTAYDTSHTNTETWSIVSGPVNGMLTGFPATATANGGYVTPAGLTYTGNSGYTGVDSFTISVNNGNGSTSTTIYVDLMTPPVAMVTFTPALMGGTSLCNGTNDTVSFSGADTYGWTSSNASVGIGASGSGNIMFAANDSSASMPVSTVLMVTPMVGACAGSAQSYTVTVNPTPMVDTPLTQIVCNGARDSVTFNGPVGGTSYSWMNSNTSIGAGPGATGNVPAFTASNSTASQVIAVFTVTPSANGCTGAAYMFDIKVNPTPSMSAVDDTFYCNGFPTAAINFSADVTGTTFNWNNNNTNIGLGASATDVASIPSFTANDTSAAAITASVTVTPVASGCVGSSKMFTIMVNPTPLLTQAITRFSICDSSAFNDTLSSRTSGASFTWTRGAVSGIENAGNSGGSIIGESLVDTTADTAVATYVVVLSANGCTNTQNINVTVSPTPVLTSGYTVAPICSGDTVNYMPSSTTSPIIFSWVRDSIDGISPGSNVGSPNVYEALSNSTAAPIVVTYIYRMDAFGCHTYNDVEVTVNPTPMLSSTLTPPSVCDSTLFHYIATSSTPGTTITWSRAVVAGITNPASGGADSVNEWLDNTTVSPVAVTYEDTLNYNGCYNVQAVMVTVNPKPMLSGSAIQPSICDSSVFLYVPASATTGATFSWSRATVTGISNPAASGTDTIMERLVNTTTGQVTVTYVDTIKANGCMNIQSITDTVNPKPEFSSVTAFSICDSNVFNYFTIASSTASVDFAWSRPYEPGILEAPATGTGNPNEQLINTTNFVVVDTYKYTLSLQYAPACTNMQNVTVTVNPTATLSSGFSAAVCSDVPFNYTPTSNTPGVSFYWRRPYVAGITPATGHDTGAIHETLVDTESVAVSVLYRIGLNINGCADTDNLVLTVNPTPPSGTISLMPASTVCSQTLYQNFGAATPAPAGEQYKWSAINATVYLAGEGKQYALVNFVDGSTTATVTLTTVEGSTTCKNSASSAVFTVGSSVSNNPEVTYFDGQFMCLLNGEAAYQWGYDDAVTLAPTTLAGQINQQYFETDPDLSYRFYWVKTTDTDGCFSKAYYNAPNALGVTNVTSVSSVKVFPNPASDNINIEVSSADETNLTAEVVNLMGQKVVNVNLADGRAALNVANLPAGCYLVDCYRNGTRVATTKFIKN